jgi:hypothetical protein
MKANTNNSERKQAPPVIELARQEWLREPSTAELKESLARANALASAGWLAAVLFGALFLWVCCR